VHFASGILGERSWIAVYSGSDARFTAFIVMSTNSPNVWCLFLFRLMYPDQTDLSHGTGMIVRGTSMMSCFSRLQNPMRMHCQDLMK